MKSSLSLLDFYLFIHLFLDLDDEGAVWSHFI